MPLLQTFFGYKSIYKTYESTNIYIEKTLYKSYNLLGWYAFDGEPLTAPYTNRANTEPRASFQHLKINTESNINFGISGGVSQLSRWTLRFPREKMRKTPEQWQKILRQRLVSVRVLNKFIGRLTSSAVAILPTPLPYRALQHKQIQGMHSKNSREGKNHTLGQAKRELNCRI